MDKVKFEELMKKEDFVKKVFESKTSKELESILQKEGLEVSETDLKQIMDSIAVLTKTSTPVEIKDPTISPPIPLSDEQSTQISGGREGNPYENRTSQSQPINYSDPGLSPEDAPSAPDYPGVNSSSGAMEGALAGAVTGTSVAGIMFGAYALYKWKKKRDEDHRRYRNKIFWRGF